MAFSCGCEVKAGEPIPLETIRAHYKHTMEAILFWELMVRKGKDLGDDRLKLSQARIDLIEAIARMFPEVLKES